MERSSRNQNRVTRTNQQISRGSPLGRFVTGIRAMLGLTVSPAYTGATLDEADRSETSRSVEKAAKRGDARGRRARKAIADKTAGSKPAARKIAQKRGAKMASAAKADTVDRAKAASRANRTGKGARKKSSATRSE